MGLAWQDQLSVQKLMESTSKVEVLQSADWALVKQSNTAELAEVHCKELKQAGRLQYYQQEWIRLTRDNQWVPNTEIPPFSFSKGEQEVI